MTSFESLYESAALELFAAYEAAINYFDFLAKRLPQQYGISAAYLCNRHQRVVQQSRLFYNRQTCPLLYEYTNAKMPIIGLPYVYGSFYYEKTLDASNIHNLLDQQTALFTTFHETQVEKVEKIQPLSIWFIEQTANFISIDELEDRLLAEENLPDLVLILNQGILVRLTKHSIEQIYALEQKGIIQSYEKNLTKDLIDITEKTVLAKYFKLSSNASYKNLFAFYVFMLELLKQQPLVSNDISPEMQAIWL